MSRALILGIVVAAALTIYGVVDCAMTDAKRTRVMQKPIWLVVILLIPVVGPLLWIFIGKAPNGREPKRAVNPDDSNLGRSNDSSMHDARIRELEEEMRKLDEEIERDRRDTMRNHPSNHTGANPVITQNDDEDADEPAAEPDGDNAGAEGDNNGDDEGKRS